MTRIDLVELLRSREIVHPSRLTSVRSPCDGSLQIEVFGYPWWLGRSDAGEDAHITFHFNGLDEGDLPVSTFLGDAYNWDLENFHAMPLSEAKWIKGVVCEVFCNAPVPDPTAVYVALDDYLAAECCPRGLFDFLNARTMGGFLKIARETSFLLCRGPEAVCGVVCDALSKQQASFNVIRGNHKESETGVLVELDSARFTCAEAYAVFE